MDAIEKMYLEEEIKRYTREKRYLLGRIQDNRERAEIRQQCADRLKVINIILESLTLDRYR